MKKVFTFLLILVFSAGLMAQNKQFKTSGVKNVKQIKKEVLNPTGALATQVNKPIRTVSDTKAPLEKIEMGMSINPYTLLVPESNCLTYHPDVNLIAFTARTNLPSPINGNRVGTYFSTDGGFNFDNTTVQPWQIPVSGNNARYPAGAIYNPAGNQDPANASIVVAAPMLTTATGGSWGGSLFSSQKFDGSNLDQQYTIYGTNLVNGYDITFPRQYLQARGSNFFVLGNDHKDNGTYYTEFNTIICKGEWNNANNKVDWAFSLLQPDFALGPDGLPDGSYGTAIAMEENAQTGYIIYSGRNSAASDTMTYQPVVYKTTDGAVTWTKQVLNWETIPIIATYAADVSDVSRVMFFAPLDATIDINGHLHFTNFVYPAASDHVDSLGYYIKYANIKGFVFDTHQTATGWDAFVVDTVFAQDAVNFPFPPDLDTYDERFQMGRSKFGSKIVYAWNDTDTAYDATNIFPDIMVRMYNVDGEVLGERHNVTTQTEADMDAFWMFLSETIIDDGGNLYTIPLSMSNHGGADTDPVTHYYLNGVQIAAPLPVGVANNSITKINCEIYPNPSNDVVTIMVEEAGNYTVNIYNSISKATSTHKINGNVVSIDLSNLPVGMYFVEITSENGKVVKKLIKN